METVIRHLAVNNVRSNGLLCGKSYKDLTITEGKVVRTPTNQSYGIIRECKSSEDFLTYSIKPAVLLVPCKECVNESPY